MTDCTKYDSAGNVQWAKSAGGTSQEFASGVATDGSGSAYVTGWFLGGTVTFGSYTLTGVGPGRHLFMAKYDSTGDVVWAVLAGAALHDAFSDVNAVSIATDALGSTYVLGDFYGTVSIGTFVLTSAPHSQLFNKLDYFVAKYDDAGHVESVASASAGPTREDYLSAQSMATDASGSSYVTGFFAGTATFGTSITLTSAGAHDAFVAKYDSDGNVQWVVSSGATGNDMVVGRGIATDGGSSYVTGEFDGTARFGSSTLTSAGEYYDVFVAKYDDVGNVQWAVSMGSATSDSGGGIATDGSGSVYVTGDFRGTATFGAHTLTSAGSYDVFLTKLRDWPAGPCSPDRDADGIQDNVDVFPDTFSNSFQDKLTLPDENGGLTSRGDQTICVSNAAEPEGVEVRSLGGGSRPGKGQLICGASVDNFSVYSGQSVTLTCGSSATAEATAGDIELELLKNGIVAASLVLPEGNSITYEAETLEASAPSTNPDTLILMAPSGGQQALPPGQTVVLTPPATIPTVSAWGVVALALVLLAGAKIYFRRRGAVRA